MKNNKINFFRIFLILLLIISIILYVKLYIFNDSLKEVVDLPESITNRVWYEAKSLDSLKFSLGNFEYVANSNSNYQDLTSCHEYKYDKAKQIIDLNCNKYVMKIEEVTDYRLVLMISSKNNSNVYTFYNSFDLAKYINDNVIDDISDEEIEEIMKNNDFSANNRDENYKSTQLSKLSSINELSIDELLTLNEKAVILLINPNMNIDSYDFIPIFLSWINKYKNYNFYYINGNNLTINDYDLLEENEQLEDYLTGLYDNNIIILADDEYRKISIDVFLNDADEEVFNCIGEECDEIDLKIYDDENVYNSIENVLTE